MLGRVVGFSAIVSVLFGIVAGAVAILGGETRASILHTLTTFDGLLGLLLSLVLFGALGSLPVSLPIGILGGVIAAMIVKKRPSGWSIARWIALGSACGGILGFVGAGVWFGWEKAIGQQFLPAIPAMAMYGGIVGMLAGGIVAAYCKRMCSKGSALDGVAHRT